MPDTQTIAAALSAITPTTRVEGPAIHLAPATIDQLSAILRYANQHSLTIHPTGGNTKPWGHPVNAAIELHTTNLNKIKEHIWQDMTATAEAGATWSSLQSALAQHNQFVALDPLLPGTATLGGVIATNDSGALRLKYGSLRDLIIGMTIVLADGTIARTGGKVVKNVAGYDLHKLMTGAFGTLGIIAEVTFRLHALPTHIRTFTISSATADPLGLLLLQLTASQLSLHALQLRTTPEAFHLDVALATLPSVLDQQLADLKRMATPLTLEESGPETWQAHLGPPNSTQMALKATILPSKIAIVSTLVRQLSGTAAAQATGIITASFSHATPEDITHLRREVQANKGHLTILHQPPGSNLDIWGTPPDALPLMQQIKKNFDPNRILNPGYFLPGI